ncbi:MAG: 50S ribosomal protein L23 [Bacillota bacterium]|jgi:large subunit ribosomal protein L23
MDARDVIIQPIVTEKSSNLMTQDKYVFEVAEGASKAQIKQAIEAIFKVQVKKVNTVRVQGKSRRMGKFAGKTASWRKAIVTLEPGQSIKLFEGA